MMTEDWTPTRAAAWERLEAFAPMAGRDYARRRNVDAGPGRHAANVSTLSPWLRHGLLQAPEVIDRVLQDHGLNAAEKFVQEVCWRTHWKGWLERRPAVWSSYREAVRAAIDAGRGEARDYRDAVAGRTGIACFDHWARELVATG